MKRRLPMLLPMLLALGSLSGLCQARLELGANAAVAFATAGEGRQILTARDEYIRRLSPFDRGARLKTDRTVSEEEFLAHAGRSVME